MRMVLVGVDGHRNCLFLARAHIGRESAGRRWVGGDWCASQPTPPWCSQMAMTAVGRLEGSPERVLGQRKVSSRSRMRCSHYMAPFSTAVAPGDTPGRAISWSHASVRPSLIISMTSVLPQVLDLSTQPWGSQGKVVG
eukprot:3468811-Prymnesium_polylepis.1